MPAPHEGPPPSKRRRPTGSSSNFSHPSYNPNTVSHTATPSHPSNDASQRFRPPGFSSPNTYRPGLPQDSHPSPLQKPMFQRPIPSSRLGTHTEWPNSQQPLSNVPPASSSNGLAPTTNTMAAASIAPLPPMNLPNISLPVPSLSTVLPFAPAPPEFPAQMVNVDPPRQLGQPSSSQPALNRHPSNRTNGSQSVSPRIPNSALSRSHIQRRTYGTQAQQSSHLPRSNTNGIISQGNAGFAPCVGSIEPVVTALALLPDDSPILNALAQVLASQTNATISNHNPRDQILNFKGFPHNVNPTFHSLLVLSKVDLDVLAWIFVVSKHGRKDDVARRILSSLRAPLTYRVPNADRRPNSLSNATRANTQGIGAMHPVGTYRMQGGRANHSVRQRASMPRLVPNPNPGSVRGQALLNHLGQQIGGSSTGARSRSVLESPFATGPRSGAYAADMRRRQTEAQTNGILKGYTFMDGENPFNEPMRLPLGMSQKYVVFTSVQLSRVGNDPVLIFPTPAPIDPNERPEIQGGDLQIHLRCLKVEQNKPKSEWKQSWPFPASCRVNGHMVTLNQAQRYTNGKLAGIDTATNISPYLRRYKRATNENNRVTIRRQTSTATPASGTFVLFAQEILVHSRETMSNNVRSGSERYWADHRRALEEKGIITASTSNFEMARLGVVQFLTDPEGLTVSSMKVSLRCPLALTRITTPVKGKRCHHVQCFDLDNFLEYTRRSSKFECPVCNKNTAYPSMLVVSPYIENALENYKDCDEVEISQDGSMVAVERMQTGIASDDDEDEGPRPTGSGSGGNAHGSKPAEVVDLTLDSDDDDEPTSVQPQTVGSSFGAPVASTYNEASAAGQGSAGNQDVYAGSNHQQVEDGAMQGDGEEAGGNAVVLDQDIDFTFRSAEFNPWTDTSSMEPEPVLVPTRIQPAPSGNSRENWTIDVIAIDSD